MRVPGPSRPSSASTGSAPTAVERRFGDARPPGSCHSLGPPPRFGRGTPTSLGSSSWDDRHRAGPSGLESEGGLRVVTDWSTHGSEQSGQRGEAGFPSTTAPFQATVLKDANGNPPAMDRREFPPPVDRPPTGLASSSDHRSSGRAGPITGRRRHADPGPVRTRQGTLRRSPTLQATTDRVVASDGDLTQAGVRRQDVAGSPGLRVACRPGDSNGGRSGRSIRACPGSGSESSRLFRPIAGRERRRCSERGGHDVDGRRIPAFRTTRATPIARASPRRRDPRP